jgi:hypothetical protein
MSLRKFFGTKGKDDVVEPNQAVLVYLDTVGLPQEVYDENDLETLESRLEEVISGGKNLGEYDGNEFRPKEVVLFMYGPDAEALFSAIEPTLRDYPLCRGARVQIRRGPPGSAEREVRL